MGRIPAKVKPTTLAKYLEIYDLKVYQHYSDRQIVEKLKVGDTTVWDAVNYVHTHLSIYADEDMRKMYVQYLTRRLQTINEKLEKNDGQNYAKLVEAEMKVFEKMLMLQGLDDRKGDTTIIDQRGSTFTQFNIYIDGEQHSAEAGQPKTIEQTGESVESS